MKLLRILSAALVATTAAAAWTHDGQSASAQGQAQLEPLDYFDKLMPVLTHDRCINCHGDVDPFTNRSHEGGQMDPGDNCTRSGCHTQANNTNVESEDDWKTAPQAVWFVKQAGTGFVHKTNKELCDQMADRVANRGKQEFMDHLQTDFLIDLGFVGRSGGAHEDPEAAPPSMPKDTFLVAAARWMDDGFAVCEREGTIVRTETIESDRTYNPGTVQELRVKQSGSREVTVRFANGQYETKVQVKGSVTMTQTIRTETCTTIITTNTDYADADDPSAGPNAGISGRASVDVKLQPNGEYTILVRLGPEKHRSIESTSIQDGCNSVLRPPPPETLENEWSPSRFLIRGKLDNPRDRTRLAGRELHRWFERISPEEDPWLPDHYAAMAQDGTIHPVDIRTSWNIRYGPR
ncbi:MAG TPA: hypothetical protein VFO06_01010 [Gemmatimonadales bacterium]|nr:hypothetical protein [Gemmatimonadales bacterium]